jgi:hypothetical protein
MAKRFTLVLAVCVAVILKANCQPGKSKVFTQDIDNFWIAYDSVRACKDSLQQVAFIKTLYVDRGSKGLKAFMVARNYSPALYVKLINRYPKFWNSVRPNTLAVKEKSAEIEKSILKLKAIYPALKDAEMYFTVGGLRSGGTTTGNMVLVGTEIATGNAATDVSEFTSKWLAGVFKEQSAENIIPLNIHEYVHTQQTGDGDNLLAQAIKEGSCDFITELVIGRPMQTNYIKYGLLHEEELKANFKKDMFSPGLSNWLYNGQNAKTVADLGYFMGYRICRWYYDKASNKSSAVKDIIELNYSDTAAVENFLIKYGYYPDKPDKQALVQSFRQKQPLVLKTIPVADSDTLADASLKEITIVFSKAMDTSGYSISYGSRGKEFYPITGVKGFSADKTFFTLKAALLPGHEYEFVITSQGFSSAEGYPLLKDYTIKFKTRP